MKNETKKTKKEVEETPVQEEPTQQINPEDIVFDDAPSDEEMPQPETATYEEPEDKKTLKLTFVFMKLFEECLGKMPYSSILKNSKGDSIKWVDLVRFVEAKKDEMKISEMNTIIGFIANSPGEYVRPLMEIIEVAERQSELWTIQQ